MSQPKHAKECKYWTKRGEKPRSIIKNHDFEALEVLGGGREPYERSNVYTLRRPEQGEG
jgi:hypothetical protein